MYALILLLAAALVGCSDPAPDAPAPTGGGGQGGGGSDTCDDLGATGDCRYQGLGGGCDGGEVCTVDLVEGCGDRRCCTLPLNCAPAIGGRPGGVRCDADDECAAGLCVRISGEGVCLRPCEATANEDSCPTGLQCATVALDDHRSVRTCIGADGGTFQPTRTVCRHDADCVEGRYCLVTGGEQLFFAGASGLCEPGARTPRAELLLCERDGPGDPPVVWDEYGTTGSRLCPESGICTDADVERDGPLDDCSIDRAAGAACRGHVCSIPCRADAECPTPFFCRRFEEDYYDSLDPDLELGFCLLASSALPEWPCWDELDCCVGGVTRSGSRCCDKEQGICTGPTYERTHCRLQFDQNGRWSSMCDVPLGLAANGAPCADHEACESKLCAPEGTCASPCSLAAGGPDTCAAIADGTQCCPTPIGEACVPACRSDCDTGPSCTR